MSVDTLLKDEENNTQNIEGTVVKRDVNPLQK